MTKVGRSSGSRSFLPESTSRMPEEEGNLSQFPNLPTQVAQVQGNIMQQLLNEAQNQQSRIAHLETLAGYVQDQPALSPTMEVELEEVQTPTELADSADWHDSFEEASR
eukprot:6218827-Amphidinium_carterae.1